MKNSFHFILYGQPDFTVITVCLLYLMKKSFFNVVLTFQHSKKNNALIMSDFKRSVSC